MHLTVSQNKPTIITYHSDIVRQKIVARIYSPLMNRFLSSMDRIVATSPNYLKSSPVLAQYQNKVSAIPIGIEETSYPDVAEDILTTCQSRYGEGFFFFIGVLRYYKGLHLLINACKGADFKVVIAGAGPLEQKLKSQVKDLGLNNIQFAGRISDKEKMAMYQLCRGVIFSSHIRSEAFGVTLLEGAMCSKPLITAETGTGTSFVNKDGETGIVVEANSAEALGDAMQMLHADAAMAENMGRNARMRYEQLFTGKKMGERYATLYREVLDEPRCV